jgi:WD40 repeat protein
MAFLEDARRVILANRYIVDIAPLQIYSSAMIFAPQSSTVRKTCGRMPKWLRRLPITPQAWGPELQTLEGHTDRVNAVAISRDSKLVASCSNDQTVRLWDPLTGRALQKSEAIGITRNIAFSSDKNTLLTDRGVKLIAHSPVERVEQRHIDKSLTIGNDWIKQGGHSTLWLPHEYRSSYTAFHGGTFAIGLNSGRAAFIEFESSG